jgi:hypothetical protein
VSHGFAFEQNQLRLLTAQFGRAFQQVKEMAHSSFALSSIISSVQAGSTAEVALKQLQAAMTYDQQAAELNMFPPMEVTPEQKALALHNNLGVSEHEQLLTRRLTDVLAQLCAAADRRGHLAMPAAQAPPGVPGLSAASTHVQAQGAAAAAPNAAGAPLVMDPASGTMVCPYLAVVLKFLAIASVRFGTAGQQEETAFNAMRQGATDTEESFAFKVKRAAMSLQHKHHITAAYAMERFLAGLRDRSVADAVHTALVPTPNSGHTVDAALEMYLKHAAMAQGRLQAQIASQVATQVLHSGAGKVGGVGNFSRIPQKPMPVLAPEDPRAPCRLHVGAPHTNMDCKLQTLQPVRRPPPQVAAGCLGQQMQQYDAGTCFYYYMGYGYAVPAEGCYDDYEYDADGSAAPYYAAAGLNGGANPSGGLNPRTGQPYGWQPGRPGQPAPGQQQREVSRPSRPFQQPVPNCKRCGMRGAHNMGDCWYNDPHKAATWWAPALTATDAQKVLYKQRCKEVGITAKEPGTGERRMPPAAAGVWEEYCYERDCEPAGAVEDPSGWEQCVPGAACCKAVTCEDVDAGMEAAAGVVTQQAAAKLLASSWNTPV